MKSLEQRMNRFSWACAAMLVMGGFGASGQAMAACEFIGGRPGDVTYWAPLFDFGVVRISADNPVPELGEPLSDWVEVSGTLVCNTSDRYQLRGGLNSINSAPVSVQVDGKTYVTVDTGFAVDGNGLGFITEVDINSRNIRVEIVGSEGAPGPSWALIDLPVGQYPFVARRRLVGLGKRLQEGRETLSSATIPRLILDGAADSQNYTVGASVNVEVVYQVASCAPTGIDQDVDLGTFSAAARPGVGQPWSKEEDFDFTIACPSSTTPINVHALFTDNANPSNTGEALTLTGDDIPAGVELRLFQENDTPITFGPESVDPDAQGAFDLFTAPTNVETTEQVTFKARLFQTQDTVGEGEINAAARVTLTYD